jgi:hypothetical protein
MGQQPIAMCACQIRLLVISPNSPLSTLCTVHAFIRVHQNRQDGQYAATHGRAADVVARRVDSPRHRARAASSAHGVHRSSAHLGVRTCVFSVLALCRSTRPLQVPSPHFDGEMPLWHHRSCIFKREVIVDHTLRC